MEEIQKLTKIVENREKLFLKLLLATLEKSKKILWRYDPHHYVVLRNQLPPLLARHAKANDARALNLN